MLTQELKSWFVEYVKSISGGLKITQPVVVNFDNQSGVTPAPQSGRLYCGILSGYAIHGKPLGIFNITGDTVILLDAGALTDSICICTTCMFTDIPNDGNGYTFTGWAIDIIAPV